jgi:peptidoglycan/LPS O-acetylase OafA/YrhL
LKQASVPGLKNQGRYFILDALRFFLALWVTMGHFGVFPLFAGLDTATGFGRLLQHGWSSLVWGVPAVIGFFVISGFCIHLPFRRDGPFPVGRYYARRYIRILVPVAAALLIARLLGDRHPIIGPHSILWNSVLWSLACEEIYYAAYPLARFVRNRSSWGMLLVPTFLVGAILAALRPEALDGTALGTVEGAVILFPVWLLGCVLAEQSDHLTTLESPWVIWRWRFLAWFGSWICELLHFKGKISLTELMLWFGILAYFWIKKELAYSKLHHPWAPLASAGLWSYSLYLMHPQAMALLRKLRFPSLGYILDWCLSMVFILAIAYGFYLLVERPSHRLARSIMVTVGQRTASRGKVAESM